MGGGACVGHWNWQARLQQNQKNARGAKINEGNRHQVVDVRCNQSIDVHGGNGNRRTRQRRVESTQRGKPSLSSTCIACRGWANRDRGRKDMHALKGQEEYCGGRDGVLQQMCARPERGSHSRRRICMQRHETLLGESGPGCMWHADGRRSSVKRFNPT
jgi:hypothetical protein